jgi:hypothetical protein
MPTEQEINSRTNTKEGEKIMNIIRILGAITIIALLAGSAVATGTASGSDTAVITSMVTVTDAAGIELTVVNTLGQPADGATVYAYRDITQYPSAHSETNASGYTFLDLPDDTYTLAISSWEDNFYIVKEVTAPSTLTLYAADETVPVDVVGSKVDGSPLVFSGIYANIAKTWPAPMGFTNSSGKITVYMTPFTYRDIFLWNWDELYYLYHSGVTIPELDDTIFFNAAEMPTGKCVTNLVDFTSAEFISWLQEPDETWTAPRFEVESSDNVVLSEGSYYINRDLIKTDVEEKEWYFELERIYVEITPDCIMPLQDGGDFGISVETGASSYDPEDTVNLDLLIADSFDHRIDGSAIYPPPDNPDGEKQLAVYSEAHLADSSAFFDSLDMEYNYPTLTVTEPDGSVFIEESAYQLFLSYDFALPADASPGTWTVKYSFDTGPHQGVIEDITTFTVCVPGDANEDGVVNILDLPVEKRIILGQLPPTCGADANGDGEINVLDLVEIKLIILGL